MSSRNILLTLLALVLSLTSSAGSTIDDFESADFILDDHAALVPVLEGVRRVRVSYLDDEKQWQVYSMAHLAGDEGQIKLRLPDGFSLADVQVEISFTDPFPYEVYAGKSDFVTETNGTLSSLETAGNRGAPDAFQEDGEGGPPAVQESDLWKWQGDTLYFYNQLRGLQVFDFSDPANPIQTGSIRMPALGEDMYLHPDGEHLVLLAKRWSWGESEVGSEAVVIRHSDGDLVITNRVSLPGNSVVESRMVGSHLYVAMRTNRRVEVMAENDEAYFQWETGLTVEHTDLSDPDNPVASESLELMNTEGWWANATVSATSEYFIIAPYVYDREERTYKSSIHLIDIRDQSAPLEIAASTELDGQLKDKFKLRIRDNILTCVTQGGSWRGGRKTVVANYDLAALSGEGRIPLLDSLALAPEETLFATRFDGDRVYVVTAIQVDPLFVIDLSDPNNLQLLGELKIPGWSHYLQPRGDRLLSVGVEDRRVAISQFDVSDPGNLKPPLRVYLGEEGSYSWSEGNYDEQAIGYFPERGVMILPYQSFSGDWTTSATALQILTFDDDSLKKAGVIETDFAARRATLIDDDTLVSVSGREVKTLDVSDFSDPDLLSSIEAAWTVDRVIPHGDYVLQLESPGSQWYGWQGLNLEQNATLRISPDDALDNVLAQVELEGGQIAGLELLGNDLHILTTETEWIEGVEEGSNWRHTVTHQVVDLSDPTTPITGEAGRFQTGSSSRSFSGRQLENKLIAWVSETGQDHWGGWFWERHDFWGPVWGGDSSAAQILVVDCSDSSAPTLAADHRIRIDEKTEDDDASSAATLSGLIERGDQLYLSFRQSKPVTDEEGNRISYLTVHRLRVATLAGDGGLSVNPAVDVPGTIEGIREVGDDSGLLLLSKARATQAGEDQWRRWSNDLILQTLAFDGLNAFLIDEVTIPESYYRGIEITDHHFAVPSYSWSDDQGHFGINFHPFDLTGEIGDPELLELEFYPNELNYDSGILSTVGWYSGQQIWWMLNSDTIDGGEPAVIETPNQFYVDFDHVTYDLDRFLAWIPVGAYGVESVNVAALFEEFAPPGEDRGGRTKGVDRTWMKLQLSPGDLTAVSGEDDLGVLAAEEVWRYRAVEAVTYSDWMARQMGEENNVNFIVPGEDEDLDGDGLSNRAEFGWGTNPVESNRRQLQIQRTVDGGQIEIVFDLPRGHQGVSWEVQTSENMIDWESPAASSMSAEIVNLQATRMVLRYSPAELGEVTFFRLNFK